MCQHCGAALPPFALFCGECGRSVSAPAVVPSDVVPSDVVPPVVGRPLAPAPAPAPAPVPEVPVADAPGEVPPARATDAPLTTPIVVEGALPTAAADPAPTPMPVPVLLPVAPDALPWLADAPLSIDSPATPPPTHTAGLAPCASCGAPPEPDDLFCAECGNPLPGDTRAITPVPVIRPQPVALTGPEPAAPSVPEAAPDPVTLDPVTPASVLPADVVPASAAPTAADVESTRIVPRGTGGARFVLQFSTGESYTVLGSGLAGRNPRPEPGEYVDHLVTIVDPGRSVSKTHFEFGQHEGVFWVSDRHSGNGSVLREPGAEPRVCEPGRRYPVVRGTRIDIGEQFVVVS